VQHAAHEACLPCAQCAREQYDITDPQRGTDRFTKVLRFLR
jgi:hypothetical protein